MGTTRLSVQSPGILSSSLICAICSWTIFTSSGLSVLNSSVPSASETLLFLSLRIMSSISSTSGGHPQLTLRRSSGAVELNAQMSIHLDSTDVQNAFSIYPGQHFWQATSPQLDSLLHFPDFRTFQQRRKTVLNFPFFIIFPLSDLYLSLRLLSSDKFPCIYLDISILIQPSEHLLFPLFNCIFTFVVKPHCQRFSRCLFSFITYHFNILSHYLLYVWPSSSTDILSTLPRIKLLGTVFLIFPLLPQPKFLSFCCENASTCSLNFIGNK